MAKMNDDNNGDNNRTRIRLLMNYNNHMNDHNNGDQN